MSHEAASRFLYPPDAPDPIESIARTFGALALRAETTGSALLATQRAVEDSWTGIASVAAMGRYRQLVAQEVDVRAGLEDSVAVVRRYGEQMMEARSAIDEIRARYARASAELAVLDTAQNRALMLTQKAPAGDDTSRATASLAEAHACESAYRSVMRRVTAAAAACSRVLLERAGPEGGNGPLGIQATALRTAAREDPNDRILREYQVTADPSGMIEWKPSGLNGFVAWVAGREVEPQPMTHHEGEMLDACPPDQLYIFEKIKDKAWAEANARIAPSADGGGNNDHNDAFRHSYWSALQTRSRGSSWAEEYTTAHERIASNEPEREAMDLYNNEVGRRIANENPFVTGDELAQKIQDAVEEGEMLVIGPEGKLYWSDEVALESAGQDPAHTTPAPGHDPESSL